MFSSRELLINRGTTESQQALRTCVCVVDSVYVCVCETKKKKKGMKRRHDLPFISQPFFHVSLTQLARGLMTHTAWEREGNGVMHG